MLLNAFMGKVARHPVYIGGPWNCSVEFRWVNARHLSHVLLTFLARRVWVVRPSWFTIRDTQKGAPASGTRS